MKPFKKNPLNLNPGKNTNLPRNSFDIGYHSVFTSPAGLLLPAYVQDVQPGDYLNLDVKNFTRTMPVNTASFSRLKENTDFYFVPYRLLWHRFNQFYTGVDDTSTSYIAGAGGVPDSLPYITASQIYDILNNPSTLDIHNYKRSEFAQRMLDLLGYSVSNTSATSTLTMYANYKALPTPPTFNPFRLLAYQKIFFDFYRNTDYTANNASCYNVDNTGPGTNIADVTGMFEPRYVQWKKDRLTSVKPSPLSSFSNSSSSIIPQSTEGINNSTFLYRGSNLETAMDGTQLSMSKLRATMAYDRLARLTMLTPKNYESQLKSQFGVEPDNCDYCSVRFLGSFDSDLNIGEVTSTAAGETSSGSKSVLGQLAGKGISSNNKNGVIKASFSEPGVVMGIHYFTPMSEYDSNRIDGFNRKLTRNSYYMPAYDNLGLQPILGSDVAVSPVSPLYINDVQAYQARYLEYKTRVDEVHGLFQSGQSLSAWVMPRTAVLTGAGGIPSSSLYINPKVTNSIFAYAYDGTQSSDQFLCHFKYDATIVRNMSMLGIPSL